jgi:hypothetical protein
MSLSVPVGHPQTREERPPGRRRIRLGVLHHHRVPGAGNLYHQRREAGDYHAATLRRLFHKLLGPVHHCLKTRTSYDEDTAFPNITQGELQRAT